MADSKLDALTAATALDGSLFYLVRGAADFKGAADDIVRPFARVRVVDTTGAAVATAYEAGDTIDGVVLATGDAVLRATSGGNAADGIYVVPASGAASRKVGFTTYNEHPGSYISVMEGTSCSDTLWRCTSNKGGTLGSTALTFAQFMTQGSGATRVTTRTDLKALNATLEKLAYLTEAGREGIFIWQTGDYSSQVAGDTLEGIFVEASATSATSGAWVRAVGNVVLASWFGAVGDGATDDEPAINAAIAHAAAFGLSARLEAAEYAIGDTIAIGNGSASAYSTVNGVRLSGVGAPFQRLDNGGGPLEDNGTRLKWIGLAGSTMVQIAGPCRGNDIQNIALNGNALAGVGLELLSAAKGEFPSITVSDLEAAGTAIKLDVVAAESIGGQSESIPCEGNLFRGARITCTAADTIGIDLDGYTGSATNGWDSVRNRFEDTYLLVNRDGGTGVRVAFADQNTFDDIYMTGFGTSDGNEASIRLVGTATVPDGHTFPQNVRFTGNVDIGQELPVVISGTIGGGNVIDGLTLFDLQQIPRGATAAPLRFAAVETGNFPNGGFWQEFGGLSVLTPEHRNLLANSRFERATLGASIVNPANSASLLDDWIIVYDGSVTCTVSQEVFTPGQDDVPFEPKNFMRIVISAASGNSYLRLGQSRSNVNTLEGRKTTFSAWLKADASRNINFIGQQLFGSGGSAQVDTASSAQAVSTSWARKAYEVTMPSITGKTVGSGDVVFAYIDLPLNTALTIDIALPQWEAGRIDTPTERRPNTLDALIRHSPTNLIPIMDLASATTGFLAKTGAGAFAARTLTAPAAGLTISNPSGIAGDPTFALADDLAALEALSGTDTIYRRSGVSTWSAVTVAAALSFSGGTLGLNVANANTWTANQTFQTAADSATVATFKSTDAGANAGPYSDWIRDSASPAANDGLGIFRFIGRNPSAALVAYTSLVTNIKTATSGAEAAQFRILNYVAGAQTVVFDVQGGVQLGSPTGGDKGVGTLNLDNDLYKDGTKVVGARATGWGAPTGTPTRTTFATSSVTLPQLAERVKALIDDLTTHGLIGA